MSELSLGKEGRKKLSDGVSKLAMAVKSTLGPGGRTCCIRNLDRTFLTKDGVTVARYIRPTDSFEAMGADIIRQASEKTAFSAGDGTTTSTILAESILLQGIAYLDGKKKVNSVSMQRGIMHACASIVKQVKDIALPCTEKDIERIAMVSTNWDEELSTIIAEAINKVGLEGSVSVDNSNKIGRAHV